MSDQDHGDPVLSERPDDLHDLPASFWIQHRRGLVKNNTLRTHSHDACDSDSLFLTAGEHMRRFLPQFIDSHALHRIVNPAPYLLCGNSQVFRSESYIILYHGRDQLVIGILKDHPRAAADFPYPFFLTGIDSADDDIAFLRDQKRVQLL